MFDENIAAPAAKTVAAILGDPGNRDWYADHYRAYLTEKLLRWLEENHPQLPREIPQLRRRVPRRASPWRVTSTSSRFRTPA